MTSGSRAEDFLRQQRRASTLGRNLHLEQPVLGSPDLPPGPVFEDEEWSFLLGKKLLRQPSHIRAFPVKAGRRSELTIGRGDRDLAQSNPGPGLTDGQRRERPLHVVDDPTRKISRLEASVDQIARRCAGLHLHRECARAGQLTVAHF